MLNATSSVTTTLCHITYFSNRCFGESCGILPGGLTTLSRESSLINISKLFCHIMNWLSPTIFQSLPHSRNSVQLDKRSVGMSKNCLNHLNLFRPSACSKDWTPAPSILYLTSELPIELFHRILSTRWGQRCSYTESLSIPSAIKDCFGAVQQYQPHRYCVYSTCDR